MDNLEKISRLDERGEVDLVQMLVEVLSHIRAILLCGLAVAVLMGCAKLPAMLRSMRAASVPQQTTETAPVEGTAQPDSDQALYELQAESYREQIAQIQAQIKQTQEQIGQMEANKQKSALLSMDANSFSQRDVVWYVNTHYQVLTDVTLQNPDPTSNVVAAYCALLSSGDFYDFLHARLSTEIDAQWLGELVSVNGDSSLLSLTVIAPDACTADELLAAAEEYVQTRTAHISAAVAAHDLTLVQEWSGDNAESTGYRSQAERLVEAQKTYENQITVLQNQETSLRNQEVAQRAGLQATLRALPQSATTSAGTAGTAATSAVPVTVSDVIKYALIGFLLGAVLAALWFAIRFIVRDPFVSEEVLLDRYGVPVLASLRRFGGKTPWQKMLSGLSGDARRMAAPEDVAALARANIASILEAAEREGENVLLVGREPERFAAFADGSGIVSGGNIILDKSAVEKLREYENVVLVERKGAVSNRDVARELEKLFLLNKNVVGIIAL